MMQEKPHDPHEAAAQTPALDAYQKIRPLALGGVKLPHGVSNPVLRMRGGRVCMAFFVYTYTRGEIQSGVIRRPTSWLVADLATGELLERISCSREDFSDASFTEVFSTDNPNEGKATKAYYERVYGMLDAVRKRILEGGSFPEDGYEAYMRDILEVVPPAYHRFYRELSNV